MLPQSGYVAGRDGISGSPGRDGRDGLQGQYGRDGSIGLPGPAGATGNPGQTGAPGSDSVGTGGSVYTRWGRTTCGNTSTLLYHGKFDSQN